MKVNVEALLLSTTSYILLDLMISITLNSQYSFLHRYKHTNFSIAHILILYKNIWPNYHLKCKQITKLNLNNTHSHKISSLGTGEI